MFPNTNLSETVNPEVLISLCREIGLPIVDQIELPGRNPRFAPPPDNLPENIRSQLLNSLSNGLYSHQAAGIGIALEGQDLCVATSTASGKSLIFISVAANILSLDPQTRILALYPARALIQDQIEKWRSTLEVFQFKVGLIDGGVPVGARAGILESNHVILMTPDVAHAWLLGRIGEREIGKFLSKLRLLILDEAHVYEGVFGTNMSYFLRRLDAAADGGFRLMATTATLGRPEEFIQKLTGRNIRTISIDDDGSPAPRRRLLLLKGITRNSFELKARLLKEIAQRGYGKFLAFADSRRMVERLVVTTQRSDLKDVDEDLEKEDPIEVPVPGPGLIVPYRAGYETEDRLEIQKSLTTGTLAGVVSTSALELGLDIGDIDIVVLLNPPASTKAFWQRIGRTGRIRPGICILIDDSGMIIDRDRNLATYLKRDIEPNWLYLDNRYIQYTQALCTAQEVRASGNDSKAFKFFKSLPETYGRMVENELNPSEMIPDDLYPLKQRSQADPHHEFPLRSGIEPNFQVDGPGGYRLGTLTYSQVLREAYPGAVYYYMARPYRVVSLNYRQGRIHAKREKNLSTKPLANTMVFPRFSGGILSLRQGDESFVAEAEVQVSERVTGFIEIRGKAQEQNLYDANSSYSRRELNRFFPTTGVCWYFPEKHWLSEQVGAAILDAYCSTFGIQSRDIGLGMFHANVSPLGNNKCQGICIFDATHGSLRLTQRLAENFQEVLETGMALSKAQEESEIAFALDSMRKAAGELHVISLPGGPPVTQPPPIDDWVTLIDRGGTGMLQLDNGMVEVKIRDFRYTPKGLLYDLEPTQPDVKIWQVATRDVRPIYDKSPLIQFNPITGETRPVGGKVTND